MRQRDDWHLTEDVVHAQGRGDPFAAAIRGTRMPMIITNPRLPDNPIVFANEAFQNLSGYGRDELIDQNCRLLQGPGTDRAAVARIRDAVAAETSVEVDLLNYRKDGTAFWNALFVSPVRADDGTVEFFFASQLDVSDRVEAQRVTEEAKAAVEAEVRSRTAALETALAAKTTLLHELDHRVKNNLTMIGSLLRLQSRSLRDPALTAALETMLARVDALASVHRRLYESDDVARFDLGAFARGLVDDVVGSSGRRDIAVVHDIGPVRILASHASATGLVLNELVTNAVRHAFANGRPGTVRLTVRQEEGAVRVAIADDGVGFDPQRPASGTMGRMLVERLCGQLDARATWRSGEGGTSAEIVFPTVAAEAAHV